MDLLRIEVVYSLPEGEVCVALRLPPGSTASDAVKASGLLDRFPGLHRIGVYGKQVEPEVRLADGDRVEIYRPLRLDPKEARRRRALRKA